MLLPPIKAGSTSNIVQFPIYDSSSIVGALLGSLVYTSFTVHYWSRAGATGSNAITMATATQGTYASGGFVAVDGTNMVGIYEFGIPDAAVATAGEVTILLSGATNQVPTVLQIPVVANLVSDFFSATPTGTGAAPQLGIADRGTAQSATATTLVVSASTPLTANRGNGDLVCAYGSTQGYWQCKVSDGYNATTKTYTVGTWDVTPSGTINYLIGFGAPASTANPSPANITEWAGTTLPTPDTAGYPVVTVKNGTGSGEVATTAGKVNGVALVDTLTTYTGNTPQTGDAFARLGAPAGASVSADVASIKTDTSNSSLGIIIGAAATGTLSTTQMTSNLTGYTNSQLIGRVIIFTSGACDGEATDITAYTATGGLLTFTALTTAPSNGDTFKIV